MKYFVSCVFLLLALVGAAEATEVTASPNNVNGPVVQCGLITIGDGVVWSSNNCIADSGSAPPSSTAPTPVGSGGTGLTSMTANVIYKGNGTSAMVASTLSDNGTLVVTSEPVAIGTTSQGALAGILTLRYNGATQNGLIIINSQASGSTWGFGDNAGSACAPGVMCFMNVSNAAITYTDTSGNERLLGGLNVGSSYFGTAVSTNGLNVQGKLGVGTSSPAANMTADIRGALARNGDISNGTKFTTSGCSVSATAGGATAGSYTSGTTGACTVTVTMNGATGLTAPNGWACSVWDTTTTADVQKQTTFTTTTATFTGTTVSGDIVVLACNGF